MMLSDMYFLKSCLIVHHLRAENNLHYFNIDLGALTRHHRYPTRYKDTYRLPFPSNRKIVLNLSYQSLKNWNSLPKAIKTVVASDDFREQLTRFIIINNPLPEGLEV